MTTVAANILISRRFIRLKRELPGFCEAIEEYINTTGKETEQ